MLPISLTETCLPWKLHTGCIGVSTIPPKTPHPLFRQDPLKYSKCLSSPLLGNPTVSCFFCDPLSILKIAFFSEPQ